MARRSRGRWSAKRIKQSRREKLRIRKEGRRIERGKDRHRESERNRGDGDCFWLSVASSSPASVPKRPEFTLFLQDASISL